MYLYAVTIFFSAFLLFLVQPLIAKQILPWFGGSSAVWTTCLVFFQSVLLAGYAYTDWTTRRLAPKKQAWLHIGLLVASLAVLPIIADASWKPSGDEDPALRILGLLLATIGLAQTRPTGMELPLVTSGDDVAHIARFLKPDQSAYSAADVIDHLLHPVNAHS